MFLEICAEINFPISMEKTEWATQIIIFFGMLINTVTQTISVPIERRDKALQQLTKVLDSKAICRPFVDFKENTWLAQALQFYTDAAKSDRLGIGCLFGNHWLHKKWNSFIADCNPSIEYCELFALTVGVDLWGHEFRNKRVIIYCDNMSVVHMVNKSSTGCQNCMVLIRLGSKQFEI